MPLSGVFVGRFECRAFMPVHRFIRLPNLDKVIDILVAYTANKDRKKLCIIKRKILKFTVRFGSRFCGTGQVHIDTRTTVLLSKTINYAITIKAVNRGNNIKTHKTKPNMGLTSFCDWSTFSKKKNTYRFDNMKVYEFGGTL